MSLFDTFNIQSALGTSTWTPRVLISTEANRSWEAANLEPNQWKENGSLDQSYFDFSVCYLHKASLDVKHASEK